MIKIDDFHISIFEEVIGKRIICFSSNRLDVFHNEIICMERLLKISIADTNDLLLKSDFFENDDGDMYHDYLLKKDDLEVNEISSKYYINSSRIKKIEVLGRRFPIEDFKAYFDIFEKFKGVDVTDDVFIFHLVDGNQIMVLFHDYFPTINVYVGQKAIGQFFNNTRSKYSLHHTI